MATVRADHLRFQRDSSSNRSCIQQAWTRELHRVMCMQGGDGERSYARNSDACASAVALSWPLLEDAIGNMRLFNGEPSLRVADLGCATGSNTLSTVELVVSSLRRRYEDELGSAPDFEAFFSDLPSNDFNSLFRSLECFPGRTSAPFFAAGVPGSFYERLFPRGRLHVAVSFSALHWLSKIPDAVLDRRSAAWNGGRAWIDGAKEGVVAAYARQSAEDLGAFLRCRKEEMAEGGVLFILMAGRPAGTQGDGGNQLGDPDSRAKHPFTDCMDLAWQDLVNEGLIDDDTRDRFNIPAYMRSPEEVRAAFDSCGGFEVRALEYRRVEEENARERRGEWVHNPAAYGRAKGNLVRAALRPIVDAHVGTAVSEELFLRYERCVAQLDVGMIPRSCFYGVLVVSAVRKS